MNDDNFYICDLQINFKITLNCSRFIVQIDSKMSTQLQENT